MAGKGTKQCHWSLRTGCGTEIIAGAGSPGLRGYSRYKVQRTEQVKVCKSHLQRAFLGCGSAQRPGRTGVASRDWYTLRHDMCQEERIPPGKAWQQSGEVRGPWPPAGVQSNAQSPEQNQKARQGITSEDKSKNHVPRTEPARRGAVLESEIGPGVPDLGSRPQHRRLKETPGGKEPAPVGPACIVLHLR